MFMPFLVGTRYELFEELEDHHKTDITETAPKCARKMHSPLIYCSSAHDINVKNIFKVIIAKVFNVVHKLKQKHDFINEAIIEFDQSELATSAVQIYERQNEKRLRKSKSD